jgi:hypothetical protein
MFAEACEFQYFPRPYDVISSTFQDLENAYLKSRTFNDPPGCVATLGRIDTCTERHHGPRYTAVSTGRFFRLPPVTREAMTSLITLRMSPNRGSRWGRRCTAADGRPDESGETCVRQRPK